MIKIKSIYEITIDEGEITSTGPTYFTDLLRLIAADVPAGPDNPYPDLSIAEEFIDKYGGEILEDTGPGPEGEPGTVC